MKKIIFVCTGNTCRSPMAEAVAKCLWADKAEVISRGLAGSGQRISSNASIVLQKHGFSDSGHYSRMLSAKELAECDLVLTMTGSHKNIITDAVPQFSDKVFTLCEYAGFDGDIPDPYMLGIEEYDSCFEKIYNCIKVIDADKF